MLCYSQELQGWVSDIRGQSTEGTGQCLAWLCWAMSPGFLSSPEQVQTELLCSALLSFQPVSSTTVSLCSQTEFVYKMSQAHCCSPLNSPRKHIGDIQIWCGSPSLRLIWLRQGKNTRHKAGTQTQNSNSSFQGVATSLILKFKKPNKQIFIHFSRHSVGSVIVFRC